MKRWVIIMGCSACLPSSETPERSGLIESGPVRCAQPGLRDLLGPVFVPDLGLDWDRQRPSGISEESYLSY